MDRLVTFSSFANFFHWVRVDGATFPFSAISNEYRTVEAVPCTEFQNLGLGLSKSMFFKELSCLYISKDGLLWFVI